MNEGDVIARRYRIESLLAATSTAVVLAATDLELGRRVALKSLARGLSYDSAALERVARESRATLLLTHPHVVRVFGTGTLQDGRPFVVMEHLTGIDLQRWLRERGPLPAERAVTAALHACVALSEAHALGLLHRDVKPSHLFAVGPRDDQFEIKLLDFCGFKSAIQSVSGADALRGPSYASPEQLGSTPDARSDLWSLGVTLYQLLSGRLPFQANTPAELIVKIVTGEPAPLRSALPRASAKLERVILKCLEKDPARRYQTACELARALRAL